MEQPLITIELQRGPVPLFHQIAEALRYRIATGRLVPGDRLPSIRRGAEAWGVHMHTVRRAYADLAREGLVTTRAPEGTRVASHAAAAGRRPDAIEEFVSRTISEARRVHGLAPDHLADLIRTSSSADGPPTVRVIECSLAQAQGHCEEIEARWRVRAEPLALGSCGEELPDGHLVATYFHYSEIKAKWPERMHDLRFVPIRPDPALADRLPGPESGVVRARLCETDESKALHIASDLRSMLPPHLSVEPTVVVRAGVRLAPDDEGPILLSPRLWARLAPELRSDPRAFEVRYVIDTDALEALGHHFSWTSRKDDRP